MTNRIIRQQQRENAHKRVQTRFPKPVAIKVSKDKGEQAAMRRLRQINKGQLTTENGLIV